MSLIKQYSLKFGTIFKKNKRLYEKAEDKSLFNKPFYQRNAAKKLKHAQAEENEN